MQFRIAGRRKPTCEDHLIEDHVAARHPLNISRVIRSGSGIGHCGCHLDKAVSNGSGDLPADTARRDPYPPASRYPPWPGDACHFISTRFGPRAHALLDIHTRRVCATQQHTYERSLRHVLSAALLEFKFVPLHLNQMQKLMRRASPAVAAYLSSKEIRACFLAEMQQ